jgi:hypothetical protein
MKYFYIVKKNKKSTGYKLLICISYYSTKGNKYGNQYIKWQMPYNAWW